MDAAFSWLSDLIRFFGKLIPKFEIIKSTHQGVAFVRGKTIKKINPGIFIYWPFWTEIMTYPVVRQSINLPSQNLTTKDDLAVSASAICIYKVHNIIAALAEQWDLNETIRDLAMAAVRDSVCSLTFKEISEHRKNIDDTLTKKCKDILDPYGVAILSASLTDFTKTTVYSVIDNNISKTSNFIPTGDN